MTQPTALDLAAALRRREVSSVELTTEALASAHRSGLGAFVEIADKAALRAARRADARLAEGGAIPRFLGIPTGIKDHEMVAGMGTRAGSRALAWVPGLPFDGELAKRCRAAGFVLCGKLSTSELTILPFVQPDRGPPTRNPHALDRYAGGSSGGSAAAVAGGLLPIAPGSDGAGSIRIPASFCGLVGVKPGRGALFHEHDIVDPQEISGVGPLARTVRDAAGLLDALAGDVLHRENPLPGSFLAACEEPVPSLRIAVGLDSPLAEVEPEIAAAVRRLAAALGRQGHALAEIGPLDGRVEEFVPIMGYMMAKLPLPPFTERLLQPTTRWMRAAGRGVTHAELVARQTELEARILAWLGPADAWVFPTSPLVPPRLGAFEGLDAAQTFHVAAQFGAFTAPFNLAGLPAASVPVGRTTEGLPIGAQIVTRRGQDRLLLSLCAQVEALGLAERGPLYSPVA